MTQKGFALVTGTLFAIIAALHLLRIVLGWEASIAGVMIPLWPSWLAVFVAGTLAWYGYRYGKR